jgi:hypothetical protein
MRLKGARNIQPRYELGEALSGGIHMFCLRRGRLWSGPGPTRVFDCADGPNAVTVSTTYFAGPVSTDPTIPITDFTARFAVSSLSYSRSLNFFWEIGKFCW